MKCKRCKVREVEHIQKGKGYGYCTPCCIAIAKEQLKRRGK